MTRIVMGDRSKYGNRKADLSEEQERRFWSKVQKSDGCWTWQAARTVFGYGKVRANGRDRVAHRIAYELEYGPIPAELWVLHRCDNPPCVRPDHLFLGTAADNSADMLAKGRQARDDRQGFRLHPESRALIRGDRNGTRTHPDGRVRGDAHWTRRLPEQVAHRGGEQHPQARLTWEAVCSIRERYAAGAVTQKALAAEFGVVFQTISDIIRGKRWKDSGRGNSA